MKENIYFTKDELIQMLEGGETYLDVQGTIFVFKMDKSIEPCKSSNTTTSLKELAEDITKAFDKFGESLNNLAKRIDEKLSKK